MDNRESPTSLRIWLKQSQRDRLVSGSSGAGSKLCPVAALLNYRQHGGAGSGPLPLFCFVDGKGLTREHFVTWVRYGLREAGLDEAMYCSHSFRIGAATTVASKGVEDSVSKTLGRWESACKVAEAATNQRNNPLS